MKRVTFLIFALSFVVLICLIYISKKGVGLRAATLIRPTEVESLSVIAEAVTTRLFPEFKEHEIFIFGSDRDGKYRDLLRHLQKSFEKNYQEKVTTDNEVQTLKDCPKNCWIFVPEYLANELGENSFINRQIKPLGRTYLGITIIEFDRDEVVPSDCESEQRLSFDCMRGLSIHDAKRKMKSTEKKYFFLRQYNAKDVFLFIEK